MSNLEPIQCPNCGGYKVSRQTSAGTALTHIVLIFLTAGIWIFVLLFIGLLNMNSPVKYGETIKCSICGYSWVYGGIQASNYDDQIKELVRQGKKIDAVKVLRQHINIGLGDAKKYVDEMEKNL